MLCYVLVESTTALNINKESYLRLSEHYLKVHLRLCKKMLPSILIFSGNIATWLKAEYFSLMTEFYFFFLFFFVILASVEIAFISHDQMNICKWYFLLYILKKKFKLLFKDVAIYDKWSPLSLSELTPYWITLGLTH